MWCKKYGDAGNAMQRHNLLRLTFFGSSVVIPRTVGGAAVFVCILVILLRSLQWSVDVVVAGAVMHLPVWSGE